MKGIVLVAAVMICLIITATMVTATNQPQETITQKIDRVCGADNSCKLREEIRVLNSSELANQNNQDSQIGN